MKKSAIALAVFAAALFAVSCQKETTPEQNESGPMTISAVTEGIGADVKADLAYKYDVIWRTGDKICVKNSEKSVDFTLSGGEGTTRGTFSSVTSITGEVEGFYPASVANLVWPAEQQNNQVPPMYCKKNLTSTQNQTFSFASLGSVLQLTFSTTSKDVVLKSIEVKADEAMSGTFTIDNGQAKVSQPEGDKPGITLELGDTGVALGVTAKKFNIAIPAGTYTNLTITFIAKDGQKCTKHATKAQSIEYNTVNTLAVSGEFKPAGVLPGVFTVSDNNGETTKQIYFSQGNLYYDGSKFNFEANQYSFKNSWDATHVSHFYWSKDPNEAIKKDYNSEQEVSGDDVFFTNENDTTAKASFTVNVNGKDQTGWRTLSTKEWQYLFNTRTMKNDGARSENLTLSGITVEGVTFKGVVLFPDNFTDQADWKTKYTTWIALNDAGLVFLPAAGFRYSSVFNFASGNVRGYYWSSSAKDGSNAYNVYYDGSITPNDYENRGNVGSSVRLITECQ